MADIRNIRPFGTVPPDKIKRVINGKLTEIKKAYRCINGKLVVVWDIGDTPEPPAANEFILVYNPTESSGAYWANVPQIEEVGESHAGTIDWGDGTVEPFWSNNGQNHNYGKPGIYTVKINCPIEKIRGDNVSYGWVFPRTSLQSIEHFPDSLKEIGAWAFHRYSLKQDTLDFNNVENILHNAFGSDTFYPDGYIKNIIGKNVLKVGDSAFALNKDLLTADLPNAEYLSRKCFYSCKNLKNIHLSNVKSIGSQAFMSCKSLEYIEIPETIEYIYPGTRQGYGPFEGCENLKTIRIHKPKGSISVGLEYAPWNAPNTTEIIWD